MIALAGAAVGFLAYNLRPASLFIGQSGGLVAGVILAVGAIEVQPSLAAPERHLVPIILLGIPLTDAVVVALGTAQPPQTSDDVAGPDHLPHRLRALGWPASRVVALFVVVQLLLSGLALFVGRGVLEPAIGAGAAALVLIVLVFLALHGRVYQEPATRSERRGSSSSSAASCSCSPRRRSRRCSRPGGARLARAGT